MTEQITIAGEVFDAPVRYEEGHELTAGEAAALNQTFHENLRNNFAKRVKDAKDNGSFDLDALKAEFAAYAEEYAFGIRTGGGGATRDPVLAEAMNIARGQVRAAIRKKGLKLADVQATAVTNAAKKLIEKNPDILELARARVEETKAVSTDDLSDLVADLPMKSVAA